MILDFRTTTHKQDDFSRYDVTRFDCGGGAIKEGPWVLVSLHNYKFPDFDLIARLIAVECGAWVGHGVRMGSPRC